MVDAAFPVGFRMGISKVVVMAVVLLCQDASSHNRLAVNSVHTGHIPGLLGQKMQTYQCLER